MIQCYGANARLKLALLFKARVRYAVTTLKSKRQEIVQSIRLYEKQIAQAPADLALVTASIRILEASGVSKLKAHLRKHKERSIEGLWNRLRPGAGIWSTPPGITACALAFTR